MICASNPGRQRRRRAGHGAHRRGGHGPPALQRLRRRRAPPPPLQGPKGSCRRSPAKQAFVVRGHGVPSGPRVAGDWHTNGRPLLLARPLIARNHLWRRRGLWRLLRVVILVQARHQPYQAFVRVSVPHRLSGAARNALTPVRFAVRNGESLTDTLCETANRHGRAASTVYIPSAC